METVIKFHNVIKTYDEKRALDKLSCEFPEGQVTGLLGPNGAGKSTVMKMVVGLTKPHSGEILVWGNAPSIGTNAQIAYLPDRCSWYEFQLVKDAIAYAGKILPGFNVKKGFDLSESMHLDPEIKVASLSRGQQACLNLIFCLARDVKMVLLDEPFSGIDLISRERIIHGIIDTIMDNKKTIIISTHEIYESESLFENVVFLDEGKAILSENVEKLRSQEGSLETVYRRLYR